MNKKMEQHYIISVSAKGILPKDEEKYRKEVIAPLENFFGPIQEISGAQWFLSGGGMDEKVYHATLLKDYRLSPSAEEKIKNINNTFFKENNRNLKIFKLEEIIN